MRIWFSGPRILGGLIRPGVSFGREDLRALRGHKRAVASGQQSTPRSGLTRALIFLGQMIIAIPITAVLCGMLWLVLELLLGPK